tara:strand:- start:786 stop:1400 length:615 start_codon:yes stop_codon:yes gene_type:complete
MSNYVDRETWLNAAAVLMQASVFTDAAIEPQAWESVRYRVTCGFPLGYRGSRGTKQITLGQAFDPSISADGTYEVCVNPIMDAPADVLAVLAHELVHVYCGIECGHRGAFRRVAVAIGLAGKMTATVAGSKLAETLADIADQLGPYPHAKIDPTLRKKQGTRNLKLVCNECGFTARTSGKWMSQATQPHSMCPVCDEQGSLVAE